MSPGEGQTTVGVQHLSIVCKRRQNVLPVFVWRSSSLHRAQTKVEGEGSEFLSWFVDNDTWSLRSGGPSWGCQSGVARASP